MARIGRLAPGFTAKTNCLVDMVVIACGVASSDGWRAASLLPADLRTSTWIFAALGSTWLVVAAALRHYDAAAYERSPLDDIAMITTQSFAVLTVLAILGFVAPEGTPMPAMDWLIALLWAPCLLLRFLLFRQVARRERPVDEVLIVGIGPIARLTVQDIRQRGSHRVIGHLRFQDEPDRDLDLLQRHYQREGESLNLLGTAADLEDVLRRMAVDEVYLPGKVGKHLEETQNAIRVCEKFGLPFALPAYAFRLERAQAVAAAAVSDGYLHYQNTGVTPAQLSLKRLFDILSSGVALWLLMPLFLAVAAAIKLTSRGPIFFRQVRVGLYGRPFHMLKFRSMVVNAEALKAQLARANEQTGPVFKMKRDPRVTRVGRFIRKYSIDELPQLINVLRGDMSVVGPRPPVPDEVAKYEAWQRRRLSVRPGLTCIWQVSGRNQISFEDWMYLDMQYIDHWSLAGDFNLIFRTVPVVITGRGAS